MTWILLGFLAFILLTVFDLNKLKPTHPFFNVFFAVGCLILAYASAQIALRTPQCFSFKATPVFWVLAIAGLIEMFYALFFALPFHTTYVEGTRPDNVVDTGLYALCRHPGVWGFFAFYLFASLALGSGDLLVAGLVWTLCDVAHVAMQDYWFFEKTLPGYASYRKRVPFLFFGPSQIRQCIQTFTKGKKA